MSQNTSIFPRFKAVSDFAVLVEFGEKIDALAYKNVLHLGQRIAQHPFRGFVETVPAFVNILVSFDPMVTNHSTVVEALNERLNEPDTANHKRKTREVLVCYDGTFAADNQAIAYAKEVSTNYIADAHISGDYEVMMYGFAPGYAYLSGVPESLHMPRKPRPVRDVPAGSVIIAGGQCIVTTLMMPTGWWIIGRSPTRILTGDEARPFLFDVADNVKFKRIDSREFDAIASTK